MRSPVAFTENQQTQPQQGSAGFLDPKYVAALLVLILSVTFYEFRSSTFIGDGLRHLPALRTITEGEPVAFQPKPWLEVYRAHYDRVVVHHHFLSSGQMEHILRISSSRICSRSDGRHALGAPQRNARRETLNRG
jgi:hypothetical protein